MREGVLNEWIKIGEEVRENTGESMFLWLSWIDAVPFITIAHANIGRVDASTFVTKTTTTPAI